MRISLSMTEAFACYSKVCAPPPAGRGGSSRAGSVRYQNRDKPVAHAYATPEARKAAYVKEMLANRKNTTVTRDGKVAVTNGGGKLPKFRTRSGKSDKWVADKATTKASHDGVQRILNAATTNARYLRIKAANLKAQATYTAQQESARSVRRGFKK